MCLGKTWHVRSVKEMKRKEGRSQIMKFIETKMKSLNLFWVHWKCNFRIITKKIKQSEFCYDKVTLTKIEFLYLLGTFYVPGNA